MKSEHLLPTQKAVAAHYAVTSRTVRNWRAAGMPVREDGHYDIRAIDAWLRIRDVPGGSDLKLLGDEAQLEYRRTKTALLKLQLAVKEGELIRREDVDARRARQLAAVKSALLRIPRDVSVRLLGLTRVDIERILTQSIREAIEHLANGRNATT